jgi:pilus assembly protein Flp/PilA
MLDLIRLVNALHKDRRGVTALEYGLIAGSIALVITGAVHTLGTTINGVFIDISGANGYRAGRLTTNRRWMRRRRAGVTAV